MPKKSGKNKFKHKKTIRPVANTREKNQPVPVSVSPVKPSPAFRSTTGAAEQVAKHQYVISDIKRSLIIGASVFILLFILYFTLR